MLSVPLRLFGGPEVLQPTDQERPRPGPGEVAIRVSAVGIGRMLDLATRAGKHPYASVSLPHLLGADHAGTIAELGAEVSGLSEGQAVAVFPGIACGTCAQCRAGRDEACVSLEVIGVDRPGAYAEYSVVPAAAVIALPAGPVDLADAAAAVLTASVALNQFHAIGLRRGERVLVQAASSALGSTTAALARHLGAEVIVTSRDPAKRHTLAELGFAAVLDSDAPDLADRVRDLTDGMGVDVVVDNVGAMPSWGSSVQALATGGRLVCSGAFNGGTPAPVPLNVLYSRNLSVVGVRTGNRRSAEKVCALLGEGFRPIVDREFPLEEAAAAHAYLEAGGGVGKVLLRA